MAPRSQPLTQRWRSELLPTPKCLCYARDLADSMIVDTRWEHGIQWAYYPWCPVHPSNRHVSVAWMPGMDEESEPATVGAGPVSEGH